MAHFFLNIPLLEQQEQFLFVLNRAIVTRSRKKLGKLLIDQTFKLQST